MSERIALPLRRSVRYQRGRRGFIQGIQDGDLWHLSDLFEHLQLELETDHRRNAQDFVCRGRKSGQAPPDRFLYALRNYKADTAGNVALFSAAECRPGIHEVAENLPHEQRAPLGIAANRARQRELAFIELVPTAALTNSATSSSSRPPMAIRSTPAS